MCKRTEEQKRARREKRAAALSRFVDEFKKIGFFAVFIVCVLTLATGFVLLGLGVAVPVAIFVTALGVIGGDFFVYCNASTREKESLNKNGLAKTSDGKIAKIVDTVTGVVEKIIDSK
jgi:hypothetical protein